MTRLKVATVAGDLKVEAQVAAQLAVRDDVELFLRCADRVELLAAIRAGGLDAFVVVGNPSWFDRQSAIEASLAGIRIVAVGETRGNFEVSSALASGADIDDILHACRTSQPIASVSAPKREGHLGRLTAVWGPKGAPGRTRVAIELAHELETSGISTVLVDCDPYGGDVIQLLGVVEEMPSIVWAARMAAKDELEEEEVARYLRKIDNGPVLVPGIPRSDLWADVSEFGFGELVRKMRELFKHTICDVGFCLEPSAGYASSDGGEGRNRMARAALRDADHIVAVCRADPVGIKNFLWALEDLRLVVDLERVVIVANRVRPGEEREVAEIIHRHSGKRPVGYLPDRPERMLEAEASGKALRVISPPDFEAAVGSLAIAVGAQLRTKGLLTRLGGNRR